MLAHLIRMGLVKPVAALTGAGVGMFSALLAAAGDAPTSLAPWAQVGGSVTAVACLAYVATLLAGGKLVSLNVAELIREAAEREKSLIVIANDNHAMNERLWLRWDDRLRDGNPTQRDDRGDDRGRR